jgi:hypothetical protein
MLELTSLQLCRSLGVVFLILVAQKKLPGMFAYPAAWGDIAVGVTAPVAMWAVWFRHDEVRRRRSAWRRVFVAWTLLGLGDHLFALAMGTTHYPGVTQLFGGRPNTAMFATLPMLLFPVYMVSFADLAHLVTLDVLRQPMAAKVNMRSSPGAASQLAAQRARA